MTTKATVISPEREKLDTNLVKIEELSQRLIEALAQRKPINPALHGPEPLLYAQAMQAYWQDWMNNPAKVFEQQVGTTATPESS